MLRISLQRFAQRDRESRSSFRASARRNHRRREARPIHRHAVAECGGFLSRVTNVIQLVVPALNIGTVRSLPARWDGNITILCEREKGGLSRKRNRRCPV